MAENTKPVIFSAENLDVSYGEQIILNEANLTVHAVNVLDLSVETVAVNLLFLSF